jgi:uncharacterized membrane protein YdjX (TVP38/TMEM64 family)
MDDSHSESQLAEHPRVTSVDGARRVLVDGESMVSSKSRIYKRAAKIILLGLLVTAVALFFAYDLQRFLTIASLKSQEAAVHAAYVESPAKVIALYMLLTIAFVLFALPAASIIMMAAGAIFGVFYGTVICSFALTIGAVLSLLSARFIFRDFIERVFRAQAAIVNRGIERDGAFYLVTMRLLPMMPYFVTNLLLGLTKMPVKKFWYVSQLASLPAIFVYANAGTALANITSFAQIWSPRLFASLTLLALFPTLAKAGVNLYRKQIKRA